jgi:hypothetical protein
MIEAQGGLCAICEGPLERPHVDHDHETGKVRGVLCFNCNGGLGKFADSADLLQRAAEYLQQSNPALDLDAGRRIARMIALNSAGFLEISGRWLNDAEAS